VGCGYDVQGIGTAQGLGQDVLDTSGLDNGAHTAAGDHPCTWGRGLEHHNSATMLDGDLVGDGITNDGHHLHILPTALHRLADCIRHTTRLTNAYAHAPIVVANDNNDTKVKCPTTLNYLCHTRDINHALVKFLWLI
jgi:hypothetical protein